jgi:hypothetical protein
VVAELIAADIYDAMTAPKFYKGTSWRIPGALEELRHLSHRIAADRPNLWTVCRALETSRLSHGGAPGDQGIDSITRPGRDHKPSVRK